MTPIDLTDVPTHYKGRELTQLERERIAAARAARRDADATREAAAAPAPAPAPAPVETLGVGTVEREAGPLDLEDLDDDDDDDDDLPPRRARKAPRPVGERAAHRTVRWWWVAVAAVLGFALGAYLATVGAHSDAATSKAPHATVTTAPDGGRGRP
jgi:hypothetical protein